MIPLTFPLTLLCIWSWFTESASANANAITSIATGLLAITTVVIAYYAYGAYDASKKSYENSLLSLRQNKNNFDREQFESTFFQLLNMHSNIVNSIDLHKIDGMNQIIAKGRDCFNNFYDKLKASINNSCRSALATEANLKETLTGYHDFFGKNQNDLGHYFRNLYHIIKFVDKSEAFHDENIIKAKKQYTNLVRAQLSSSELALLFYNCLSVYGYEKFKPLIEKYSLLKNMNQDLVFNQEHLNQYSKSAYS